MGNKILPFRGYFFYNYTISPIYEYTYIFNVMCGYIGGGTIAGASSFYFIAVMHGSAKFAVLRKRLEAINNDNPDADREMINCIKDHQNAIR